MVWKNEQQFPKKACFTYQCLEYETVCGISFISALFTAQILNIGLQNGKTKKAWLSDQMFEYKYLSRSFSLGRAGKNLQG